MKGLHTTPPMRIFPMPRFAKPPIARLCGFGDHSGIEIPAPIRLRSKDKLVIVRRLSYRTPWESLSEKRQCTTCGTIFSGRQIDVVGGTRTSGPLRLLCPTEGCRSRMEDWIKLRPKRAASTEQSPIPVSTGPKAGLLKTRQKNSSDG